MKKCVDYRVYTAQRHAKHNTENHEHTIFVGTACSDVLFIEMESLLSEDKRSYKNDSDLRSSLCYYLSAIMVLATFIMSCVSMGLCSSVGNSLLPD